MSGYILCQTKKADKPFFVESINTNIYSLEELCYFLYHNLYLVDSSVINENLCTWISEELDLPRLAAKLRPHLGKFASAEDVLYPVFKEINYLTYDAVSYTHLDVYKRQLILHAKSIGFDQSLKNIQIIFVQFMAFAIMKKHTWLVHAKGKNFSHCPILIPVSYTHLLSCF